MITCSHTQMAFFQIFEPRWHDRKVLLAAHKVGTHNKIKFTRAKSLGVKPYYVSGAKVKKFKKESNGTIDCYSVPLSDLEPLEYKRGCHHLI
jgi:hypothetical protein